MEYLEAGLKQERNYQKTGIIIEASEQVAVAAAYIPLMEAHALVETSTSSFSEIYPWIFKDLITVMNSGSTTPSHHSNETRR